MRRLLTDNGSPYLSGPFSAAVAERHLLHWRTRPYRPQTNGRAQAFVRIVQNGWAYKRPHGSTPQRIAAMPAFLRYYDGYGPHGGPDGARRMQRVRQ